MKRFLLVFFIVMMLTLTAFAVSAEDFDFNDAARVGDLAAYLEEEAPKVGIKNIDISAYNIKADNTLDLYQLCVDEAPMLFQFKQIYATTENGYVTYVRFIYHDGYDPETYVADIARCKAKADELLLGIKGNDSLDTVTKALLLYDRLAMICVYDSESEAADIVEFGSDTIYGPFIKGKALCTGYSYAYMYLLNEIGVDSRIVRSKNEQGKTIHAWPVVTIDGVEYHTDLTYDDSDPDVQGRMSHDYFLISSDRINTLGKNKKYHKHEFNLSDKRYEDKYWTSSETEIVLADGFIYFISNRDEDNRGLYLVDPADSTYTPVKLLGLDEYWIKSKNGNEYEAYANYYCLSTDGEDIFYSTPKNIYVYDLSKGTTRVICAPTIEAEYDNIYGFRYDNGDFIYSIHNAPNFGDCEADPVYRDKAFQIREKYDPDATPTPNPTPGFGVSPDPNPDKPVITVYFNDVKKDHWYFSAVEYAIKRGYMNGMSQTTFAPMGNIKREQFVLILANIAGVDTTAFKNIDSGMTDVPTGQWYSGAVAWAVKNEYVSGMTPTTFGRGRDITRAQLARLFYVFAEKNGVDVGARAELSGFADAGKVQDWMRDGLCWAVDAGIISGMNINGKLSLNPNGSATRAQTAVMLMQFDACRKGE